MNSAVLRVARLLNTTGSEARNFCEQIQHQFRPGKVPSYKIIAECLEYLPTGKRTNKAVVQTIINRFPKLFTINEYRKKRGIKRRGTTSSSMVDSISPILAHDPRNATENLPKCPHGVLKIKKCAICDPKGFREEHGWD